MFRKLGMFDRSLGMFQPPGSIPFQPGQLFLAGEQGVWYDPSDFSTMFQDSAGTTPVTAIEQPVGLILDKSGRNNHASQSTTTSRPILRNLYNLLQYTEDFSNAEWINTPTAVTKGTTTGVRPDGTTGTIDTLTFPAVSGSNFSFVFQISNQKLLNVQCTFSVYAKVASGTALVFLNCEDSSSQPTAGNFFASSAQTVTTEWQKLTLTGTRSSGSGNLACIIGFDTRANAAQKNTAPITIQVWGASLVPANESSIPYQRVVTNTLGSGDYDTDVTKFPPYLFFDGLDDWLQTGNINFSATDKMSVFAGVRKLSDTALNVVTELSATIASNNGTFLLSAPNSAAANYNFSSKGTSQVDNTVTTYSAPITNVVTGLANISAPSNTIRVNGTATTVTTSQGAGNYGSAYPLYIGRRGGTTNPLNGRIYSLIIRGALTSSPQLEQTERWVAGKTGVTL